MSNNLGSREKRKLEDILKKLSIVVVNDAWNSALTNNRDKINKSDLESAEKKILPGLSKPPKGKKLLKICTILLTAFFISSLFLQIPELGKFTYINLFQQIIIFSPMLFGVILFVIISAYFILYFDD